MHFLHDYEIVSSRTVDMYGDGFGGDTKFPVESYTEVLLKCACGKIKTKKVKGKWTTASLRKEV